jgi:hypothetical protein
LCGGRFGRSGRPALFPLGEAPLKHHPHLLDIGESDVENQAQAQAEQHNQKQHR